MKASDITEEEIVAVYKELVAETGKTSVPLGHKLSEKYPWKVVAARLDRLEDREPAIMGDRGGFGPLYGYVEFNSEYLAKFL